MTNILILGSTGMLGWKVLETFLDYKNFKIFATYRNIKSLKILKKKINYNKFKKINFVKFDVLNHPDSEIKKITRNKDYIVNCIGIIKPHIDEINKKAEKALLVNSIFPYKLNEACKNINTKILQIATDCVFSGNKKNYLENDIHDVFDIYGRTKSLGEVMSNNFFNIRCSIIGPEIKEFNSLFEWFMNNKKNSNLKGFSNHLWNGVSTEVFSELLVGIILKNIRLPNLIHIIPKDQISKYKMLLEFKKITSRTDLNISKVKSSKKINRTLATIFKEKNVEIWKASKYKKILNMKEIINNLV
jgi:dTDP-4-dehydrorhamnose reductase